MGSFKDRVVAAQETMQTCLEFRKEQWELRVLAARQTYRPINNSQAMWAAFLKLEQSRDCRRFPEVFHQQAKRLKSKRRQVLTQAY